jgi:signal transduction histidine kinase
MIRELLASLRLRLWLLVFLALIPALGLMLYAAAEQRRHALSGVQDQAFRLVQLVSSDHQRLIDGTRHLLVALAHVPAVRGGDADECERFLSALLKDNPLYAGLGVADRTGEVSCSAPPRDQPVNIADRAYFRAAMDTRDFAIGEFQIGRVTHKAIIPFGYPSLDAEGRVQGVVVATMALAWLNHLMAAAELPEDAVLVVIDRNGTIIARYPNPQVWVGQSGSSDPLFEVMRVRGQGTAELSGMDGIPRIYAFTGFRGLPEAGYVSIGIPQAVAYAPVRRALARNLAYLGVVGVLALAAAWLGGDAFILRRVQALVRATKRLSGGDLSARTGLPSGPGELGQLAAAFDDMAASLEKQQAQQRLEEELRRHNEELEEQNRRIEELNRLKSEFVSLVSHELRTPLTAIIGYLDLLAENVGDQAAAQQRQIVSIIQNNADRLVRLIDELLDLSHIESGTVELRVTVVDISALITEVVKLLQPQIDARGQRLSLDLAQASPLVQGDAERIRQILINLLSNAHKYTPSGGHIWVSTADEAGRVRIDVRDNGVGLSGDEQAQVFNKFFRAREPATQGVGGTGLGLAITRLLVEMQGGQITVMSTLGQGSTFSFTLPAARMSPRIMPAQ